MLRKAKKRGFPTILARWQEQESYITSLKDHDIGEQEVIIYDRLPLERYYYAATKAERMRYSANWVLTLSAEGKQPPRQQRPDYEEAKRECQRLQDEFMAAKEQLCTPIHASKQRRQNPNQQFQGSVSRRCICSNVLQSFQDLADVVTAIKTYRSVKVLPWKVTAGPVAVSTAVGQDERGRKGGSWSRCWRGFLRRDGKGCVLTLQALMKGTWDRRTAFFLCQDVG